MTGSFSKKHSFMIFKLVYLAAFLPIAIITMSLSFSCAKPESQRIMIFSAASLVDVLQETAPIFESQTGTKIIFNFAGSQTLAGEISNGAPADIFISAGQGPAGFLVDRGHINEKNIVELVENVLVVATSDRGQYANFNDINQLLDMRRIAIADPDLAPAGEYARDEMYHSSIVYPAAVVKNANEPVLGQEYLEFLTAAYVSSVFEKYGFVSAKERMNR